MNDADLNALLQVQSQSESSDLKQRVLERTSGIIRRRVWRRRLTMAAALAACFAAGIMTATWSRPTGQCFVDSVVVRVETRAPPTVFVSLPELEMQAEQANDAERAAIYFLAGRRYASERGDWGSALRCYQQALDAAPETVETIDPKTDDWLLVALKIERQKERENALRNE